MRRLAQTGKRLALVRARGGRPNVRVVLGVTVAAVALTSSLLGDAALNEPKPRSRLSSSNNKKASAANASHYTYVVIGSGTAAYTALESIRQGSKRGERILLVSDEQHMARLDVADDQSHLDEHLQDVYNEWRRHIACRLASDDQTRVIGPAESLIKVRKFGTRRDKSFDMKEVAQDVSDEQLNSVSVLVENLGEISINSSERKVTLSDGSQISYERCLLAPPGHPRELYVLKSSISITLKDKINMLKDAQDFQDLQRVLEKGNQKIVVVGGGFLGTTLCAALMDMNRSNGTNNQIVQTFVESLPLQAYFPQYLSSHIMEQLKKRGLQVVPDRLVTAISRDEKDMDHINVPPPKSQSEEQVKEEEEEEEEDDHSVGIRGQDSSKVAVTLMQGTFKEQIEDCDLVVLASTNVNPDVGIAERSKLETDPKNGGVVCNSSLECYNGLFVAGTSASFFDPILGRRRVDFYDNALNMGLLAGQNMTSEDGRLLQYKHQPTFRCILPGTGLVFEAVGQINSNDPTVGVWLSKRDPKTGKPLNETAYERGVVFYLRDNIVVGILTCNASECMEAARDILRDQLTYEKATSRIMLAPSNWVHVFHTR